MCLLLVCVVSGRNENMSDMQWAADKSVLDAAGVMSRVLAVASDRTTRGVC